MVQQNTKTEPQRTRVLVKRQSRNGCYTCKERKIRCDETRPYCTKCTRSGRSCGGYSTWHRQEPQLHEQSVPVSMNTLSRVLPPSGIQSRGETLEFFSLGRQFLCHEMCGFSGLTDQFWKQFLPQIAHADLGAHAACVVLGTAVMHRRDNTDDRFSIVSKYYGRAIRQIQHDLVARPTEILNIACMCFLLVMTDLLLNRHVQALAHLQGALALLHSRQQVSSDHSINFRSGLSESSGFSLVEVIDIAAVSLDISVSSYATELPPRLPSPRTFDATCSSELKSQELQAFSTLHSAYEFLSRVSNFKYMPIQFHPQGIEIDHGRHIANILSVTHALSLALEQSVSQDKTRLLILRMQCHSCLIRLATILCPEECIYDTYTELFRIIIEDADTVMSHEIQVSLHRDRLVFSADLGLVQPLSFTAMKCRDLDIRSAAIRLLEQCGTDGPFDAKVLAAVSRRVIELETSQHESNQRSVHNSSGLVPERLRICGCGPDLSQVRKAGDPQVSAFFSRCVDVSAMMAEQSPDGFENSTHWEIWIEVISLNDADTL